MVLCASLCVVLGVVISGACPEFYWISAHQGSLSTLNGFPFGCGLESQFVLPGYFQ